MPNTVQQHPLPPLHQAWLEHALAKGDGLGRMKQDNITRDLFPQLPKAGFDPCLELYPFWIYNRLTVLGLYKIKPDHPLLLTLDRMMHALCDHPHGLAYEPDRTRVTAGEFVAKLGPESQELVSIALADYFYEFWAMPSGHGRVDNDQAGQRFYELEGAIQNILAYPGLDAHMEALWQKSQRPAIAQAHGTLKPANVLSDHDRLMGYGADPQIASLEPGPDPDLDPEPVEEPEERFQLPKPKAWKDLTITLYKPDVLRVQVAGQKEVKAYFTDLDCLDRKSFKPNLKWRILTEILAPQYGSFTSKDFRVLESRTAPKHLISNFRVYLKKLFDLDEDPIISPQDLTRDGSFQTKFVIRPTPKDQQELDQ